MSPATDWVVRGDGYALDFDGTDDRVESPLVLTQTDNWTLAAWHNPSSTVLNRRILLYVGTGASNGFGIASSGNVAGRISVLFGAVAWKDSSQSYTAGQWYHIAAVRSSGELRIYSNGKQIYSDSASTPNTPTSMTYVGWDGGNNRAIGPVDDTRIYNRALLPAEIQTLAIRRGIAYEQRTTEILAPSTFEGRTLATEKGRDGIYSGDRDVTRIKRDWSSEFTTEVLSETSPITPTVIAPRYESLKQGLIGAWCPSVTGPTGGVLKDLSGRSRHGTLTNMDPATDWIVDGGKGGSGYCLDFDDNNDEVLVPKAGLIPKYVTVSAWVKSIGARNDTQGMVTLDGGSADAYRLFLKDDGTHRAGVVFRVAGSSPTAEWTNPIAVGWYHLCGTYDGTTAKFYMDGILRASTAKAGTIQDPGFGSYFVLGTRDALGSAGTYWDGYIDDVRIYNRALTPYEIQLLASKRGIGLNDRPTIAYTRAEPPTLRQLKLPNPKSSAWKHPNLWVGCVGAWCPSQTGPTGSTLRDLSGRSNHGTLTTMDPATDWVVSGGDYSLDFDGTNDHVDLGTGTYGIPAGSRGVTLSVWVSVDVFASFPALIGKVTGVSPYGGWMLNLDATGSKFQFSLNAGTWQNAGTPSTSSTNRWYHICGTYDGATIRLWKDGVLDTSRIYSGTIQYQSESATVYLGRNGSTYFNGKLDDIRLYNRALTPAEIATLASKRGSAYERETTVTSIPLDTSTSATPFVHTDSKTHSVRRWTYPNLWTGCVGAWCPSITGPTGGRLLDLSGRHNNGTLTGMAPASDWVVSGDKGGGYALDFDGANDYVSLGSPSTVNFGAGDWSLSCWFLTRATDRQMLIAKDESGQRQFGLVYDGENNINDTLQVFYGKTDGSLVIENSDAINLVAANVLAHLLGQRRGDSLELFLNGSLIASTLSGTHGTMKSATCTLMLGRRGFSGFTDELNGKLDDIRIYNRALTAAEIATLASRRGAAYQQRILPWSTLAEPASEEAEAALFFFNNFSTGFQNMVGNLYG